MAPCDSPPPLWSCRSLKAEVTACQRVAPPCRQLMRTVTSIRLRAPQHPGQWKCQGMILMAPIRFQAAQQTTRQWQGSYQIDRQCQRFGRWSESLRRRMLRPLLH